MNIFWGLLMIAIGAFLSISGFVRSNFIIYRLFVARSRILWGDGDKVHNFYVIVGILVVVFGILFTIGVFNK